METAESESPGVDSEHGAPNDGTDIKSMRLVQRESAVDPEGRVLGT